jgi:IS5 family transposase
MDDEERRQLARHLAIEPIIDYLQAEHRMGCCHLKGERDDRLHAVLCAAGYNRSWLARNLAKQPRTVVLALLRIVVRIPDVGHWG